MWVVQFFPCLNSLYMVIAVKAAVQTSWTPLVLKKQTFCMNNSMMNFVNEVFILETGQFGAMMDVQFTNDGPVTLILESK